MDVGQALEHLFVLLGDFDAFGHFVMNLDFCMHVLDPSKLLDLFLIDDVCFMRRTEGVSPPTFDLFQASLVAFVIFITLHALRDVFVDENGEVAESVAGRGIQNLATHALLALTVLLERIIIGRCLVNQLLTALELHFADDFGPAHGAWIRVVFAYFDFIFDRHLSFLHSVHRL